jgi:hypothetical protein
MAHEWERPADRRPVPTLQMLNMQWQDFVHLLLKDAMALPIAKDCRYGIYIHAFFCYRLSIPQSVLPLRFLGYYKTYFQLKIILASQMPSKFFR